MLYAPHPRAAQGLSDDVRLVRRELHRQAGITTRLRARLAPRSGVRVLWRLRERRAALGARWRRTSDRVTSRVMALWPGRTSP